MENITSKMIMKEFLKTEEGKKIKQQIETAKTISIEDKVKFVDKVKERSKHLEPGELLFEKGEKVKYFLYLDDVAKYKFEKYIEENLTEYKMKDEFLFKNNNENKNVRMPIKHRPHIFRG